jgi:phosphomannomutase
MDERDRLIDLLDKDPFTEIDGVEITHKLTIDGYKFDLSDGSWLLIRFSGTEPVLRLYSEAPTLDRVHQILNWIQKQLKVV